MGISALRQDVHAENAVRCPLCGGGRLAAYRGRENARCATCGAKERERLMALALEKTAPDNRGLPVYHFAPERALAARLVARYGAAYRAADFNPLFYASIGTPVQAIDLRRPLNFLAPQSVGGLVHSHVLEHVPASLDQVVRDMNRAIAPGGFHVFQVPIHPGWYREDMDPDMPADERTARFFQDDHMRCFGVADFAERMLALFDDFDRVDLGALLSVRDLAQAGVPPSALNHFTGHSVFMFVKRA